MTKSHEDLISDFVYYGATGKGSNMEVTNAPDGSAWLWDYGWALIAYRDSSGRVYVYEGWEGYSPTTTKHIRYFKPDDAHYGLYRADEYVDAEPKVEKNSFDPDGREELQDPLYDYDEIQP